MRLPLAILATLVSPSAFAWFDTGHMVVAEIAYRRLTPEARRKADDLVGIASDARTNDFRALACYADDHKSSADAHWHYTNIFFRQDGKQAKGKPRDENVVWAIDKFTKELSNKNAGALNRGIALRYLLHFVGDIHQPCHSTALESDKWPQGDRGGNEFKLVSPPNYHPAPSNMHFLWDGCIGQFKEIVRPMNDEGQRLLIRYADMAEAASPYEKVKGLVALKAPSDWANESHRLAREVVYMNIRENEVPSSSYITTAQKAALERVALAGYRLAELVNSAL